MNLREKIQEAVGEKVDRRTDYELAILNGLQGKPVYGGTVSKNEQRRRRAVNKRARAARRVQRR